MSKTASSAVVRAVTARRPSPSSRSTCWSRSTSPTSRPTTAAPIPTRRPRHVFHAAHLLRHLPTPEHPWLVVTIVREPAMRAISDFFQSGQRLGRLGDDASTTARFVRFAAADGIPRTVDWFDRELGPTLGIDVYDHPFDPASARP